MSKIYGVDGSHVELETIISYFEDHPLIAQAKGTFQQDTSVEGVHSTAKIEITAHLVDGAILSENNPSFCLCLPPGVTLEVTYQ